MSSYLCLNNEEKEEIGLGVNLRKNSKWRLN
jgi:hypothetical protein